MKTEKSTEMNDISYCCQNNETIELTGKILVWITARQDEGWTVKPSIRQDPGSRQLGVMWQCIEHRDGQWREFTDCISMTGREFRMN